MAIENSDRKFQGFLNVSIKLFLIELRKDLVKYEMLIHLIVKRL